MKANIADPGFEYNDDDPTGYRSGMARLGPGLGASRTGVSVYELPPGQSICPYHFEYAEEEWLLVLAGAPTLRTPAGEEVLAPSDLVFFPIGPEGAHKVTNATDAPVRVLMFSDVATPAVSVYPDSGKVGVFPGDRDANLIARRADGVDYWEGEA